ncbi:MAG: acyl carrier protein [Peptococcaceae bacterium]|jgi:acyl carrier protein|nr:acyl carrier protein [Peptococcaceae bacterium]
MVFEQVKESLAEILSKDVDMIDMDTKLVDDLGVDSIDSVELIMAVEEVYDITVPEEDAMAMKTVGDVVEYIEDHIVED